MVVLKQSEGKLLLLLVQKLVLVLELKLVHRLEHSILVNGINS